MPVSIISPPAVLASVAKSLGVPIPAEDYRPLVAQALRRAIDAEAPCARYRVEQRVFQALSRLNAQVPWIELIEDCLDDLIHYGDVFEMRVDDGEALRESFQLWPAPPAFVLRRDGSLVLLGIAPDELLPSTDWPTTIEYRKSLRFLPAHPDNAAILADLDLPRLHEDVWLRAPVSCTPRQFVDDWRAQLIAQPSSGAIEGLELLGGAGPARGRRQRWSAPTERDEGLFPARRAQRYGSPRWCVVHVSKGVPQHFVDLSARGDVERACDIGWRLKAAIDAVAGRPQTFDVEDADAAKSLTFFQPLPSWAERRLAVLADKQETARGLFSFSVPAGAFDTEAAFLAERLWTVPKSPGGAA